MAGDTDNNAFNNYTEIERVFLLHSLASCFWLLDSRRRLPCSFHEQRRLAAPAAEIGPSFDNSRSRALTDRRGET